MLLHCNIVSVIQFLGGEFVASFEVLCVTMNQSDFSKIEEMNIHSNVVFSNQCGKCGYEEYCFEDNIAKMISTNTKGVGTNRNLALMYATAEILLLADDDIVYKDNMSEIILNEFEKYPDAEVIVFHLESDSLQRPQRQYKKTKRHFFFNRKPWGTFRIAVRKSALDKANVWFNTLFGGGCVFPSGEDSLWLNALKKAGLRFYVSDKTIGKVSFNESSWFTGYDEKFYYGKGAYYQAAHPKTTFFWKIYFALRTLKNKELSLTSKFSWMSRGQFGYKKTMGFDEYIRVYEL